MRRKRPGSNRQFAPESQQPGQESTKAVLGKFKSQLSRKRAETPCAHRPSLRDMLNAAALLLTSLFIHPATARINTAPTAGTTPFSGERAFEHVKKLVEFGPHPAGSKAIEQARRYIIDHLPNASRDEWTASTPAGNVKMVNIVSELKGESDDTIIIASHYDTKPFKEFRFVGANDSGSSTGALMEIANTLAASHERRRYTYRFVFFDGEEAFCREWDECGKPDTPDNTYGSRHYVEQLRASGQLKKARALILLDMMGYSKLDLGRDDMSTPWLVDIIWKTAQGIGYSKQFVDRAEGVGGDDHAPFLQAGIPSADIIQLSTYPFWHKPEDTLDKVSPASLKAVGDAVIASLPHIEERLKQGEERVSSSLIHEGEFTLRSRSRNRK